MLRKVLLAVLAAVSLGVAVGCSDGRSSPSIAPNRAAAIVPFAGLKAPAFYGPATRGVSPPRLVGRTGNIKVWVTDPGANAVYLCSSSAFTDASHPRPIPTPTGAECKAPGQIEEFPFNEAEAIAERDGFVYVADTGNQQIDIFREDGSLYATISEPGLNPVDIAIASDGTLGVMNTSPSGGNITLYAANSFHKTVVTGLLRFYHNGAFDHIGNFYNDGIADGKTVVGFVAKGSSVDTETSYGNYIRYPDGIRFAKDHSLNVLDQRCGCLHVFTSSGQTKIVLSGASQPTRFSFNQTDSQVWVSDAGLNAVEVYSYPAAGAPVAAITGFVQAGGVAVVHEGSP